MHSSVLSVYSVVMTLTNIALLIALAAVFVWSAIRPHDYFTWWLEVIPAIIGFAILVATYRRFPLTPLAYTLVIIHAAILMLGGHYTYAEVPDRIGHFAQGFVPAIVAREILIRKNVVHSREWLYFIVVAICLAISAAYELLEWRVSVATGSKGDAFLGTQGDVWDTREDMATALVAALLAPLVLGRIHDRQIRMESGRTD